LRQFTFEKRLPPRMPPLPTAPRLTIVIILDHANVTGGQAKVAFDSARGLKRAGHNPIVFAACGPIDPDLEREGIEIVCLGQTDILSNPSRLDAAINGLWNRDAARALRHLLARVPSENSVVHVHGWAKALSPSIAGAIEASGLPAVYTMHEYFLFCPNGGFFNYPASATCNLEPMSARCLSTNCDSRSYAQKLWRSARHAAMQHIAGLPAVFDDFIAISKYQRAIVEHRLPARAVLHTISNPIDAENLGPKNDPSAGDVIFVGRIAREKGPLLFAEAARAAGIAPVFVGDGPLWHELAGACPEARITGWKSGAEVRALMRGARALVFPSLWHEGQPLTVLEAKALGTPVIVSDGCAGREEIEDGVAGLWFANGDAASLARALVRLKDDQLVRKLSVGAYQSFWSDPPSLSRHVAAIEALYCTMLARRDSGTRAA
jgi:glycosyltransferase involved in cell wall biosynthesis